MTRDEALALLADVAPRIRLQAARALQVEAHVDDYQVLRNHIDRESDAHVRRALVRVVHRIHPEQPATPRAAGYGRDDQSRSDLIEDVWAEATEQITGVFFHELSPLVGVVVDSAKIDLGEAFDSSRTALALARLTDLIELLAELRRAATAPAASEVDVTDLVAEVITDEGCAGDGRVRPARDDPVVIVGAASAIRIAFRNGLRNALDAVEALPEPGSGEVVVNWGVTDAGGWISVLDNGVGLPEGSDRVFDFGLTSKPKSEHFGFGLSISSQAIQSAGGTIQLSPRDSGGAALVIRWPHDRAEQ